VNKYELDFATNLTKYGRDKKLSRGASLAIKPGGRVCKNRKTNEYEEISLKCKFGQKHHAPSSN
jgi:hypothetical protein